jgi:hypothetical protein
MAEEGLGTSSRVGEFKHIMNELTPSGVEIITECNKDIRKHGDLLKMDGRMRKNVVYPNETWLEDDMSYELQVSFRDGK